jgi:nicotinate-nucleotide pyrophosphorylase
MDLLNLDPLLRQALAEDLGRGDITTNAILGQTGSSTADEIRFQATLIAKENLVLAGWPIFWEKWKQSFSVRRVPRSVREIPWVG